MLSQQYLKVNQTRPRLHRDRHVIDVMFDHTIEWPKIDDDGWLGTGQPGELSSSPAPRHYRIVFGLNKRCLQAFDRVHLNDAHRRVSQCILHI